MKVAALRIALLGITAAAALAGCSTLNVRADSSAAANVSACHTFSWLEGPPGARPDAFGNPLNDQRLRDAVSRRLQAHGIAPATSGSGDCQVGYVFGTRMTPEDYNRPRFSFGIGTGWGGWGRGGTMGSVFWDTAPYAYRENRVSVDLFRSGPGPAGPREPLWHASVDMDLASLTGAEAEKRIDEAVAAMFAKFPTTH